MSAPRNFWSRRQAGVAAEARAEQAARDAQSVEAEQAQFDGKTDAEILEALNLPDPDTLDRGDDFTVFMAKIVPDQIRRRALRTLWRSNPVLANVDMLVDYGEDFTDSAMAVENIQTAYQVGKGMLKHVQEMARQVEDLAPSESTEEDATSPVDVVEEDEALAVADEATPAVQAVAATPEPEPEHGEPSPSPRRMKFRIEESA